jgi:hypothetical protein
VFSSFCYRSLCPSVRILAYKKFGFIRKKVEEDISDNRMSFRLLSSLCRGSVRNLSLLFVQICLYSERFPTRFACENDISGGRWVESHLLEKVVFNMHTKEGKFCLLIRRTLVISLKNILKTRKRFSNG